MGNTNGCVEIVVTVIATIIASFLSYFSTPVAPETTLDQGSYPFVLDEGTIEYSFRDTLNCQFVIAGNIEFLEDDTGDYDNIVIMLQPLGTDDDRPNATVIIGTDTSFGENGWSQLLVGNYWYYVWVHDLDLEAPLSEKILVDNLDCPNERILALVNFRQVSPLR